MKLGDQLSKYVDIMKNLENHLEYHEMKINYDNLVKKTKE